MKFLYKLIKDDDGAVMVIVALALVVLLGCMALVVDAGVMYVNKAHLQNVADAAALAGASELPDTDAAEDEAIKYCTLNGVVEEDGYYIEVSSSDDDKIKVKCGKQVTYIFARALGFGEEDDPIVVASAVAQRKGQWAGEALPFINLDFDYSVTDPTAWTDVGHGIKGTIVDFYTRNSDSDEPYFEIDYTNGITVTPGYANGTKGLDHSKLSDGLAKILTVDDMGIKTVYIFSLRSDIIKARTFKVTTKKGKVETRSLDADDLKEGDTIHPDQLVLIQCRFDDCKWANQHDIETTFLGNVYDLGNDDPNYPLPDFPTEHLSSGGTSALLE